ncbi:uncharacterized protein PHACADRAFT_210662 [Phanerochaete carnosa HHB-10118-sp]|uniref:Uncharacterized protein n=1 Tax=Phanerochaete carnosa (strain HHB-10118-sp) TaxID=650164 RepID=K5VTS6_PHACS|nr:uncharacterized protein PHACADRAFT_210662 [Phanerochaete carnosa HHB-10118-sp]EKM54893.1 hypothetical protein PHACADRAFT_210662 [Phanerochaete carnosa HHB-10118-sp]
MATTMTTMTFPSPRRRVSFSTSAERSSSPPPPLPPTLLGASPPLMRARPHHHHGPGTSLLAALGPKPVRRSALPPPLVQVGETRDKGGGKGGGGSLGLVTPPLSDGEGPVRVGEKRWREERREEEEVEEKAEEKTEEKRVEERTIEKAEDEPPRRRQRPTLLDLLSVPGPLRSPSPPLAKHDTTAPASAAVDAAPAAAALSSKVEGEAQEAQDVVLPPAQQQQQLPTPELTPTGEGPAGPGADGVMDVDDDDGILGGAPPRTPTPPPGGCSLEDRWDGGAESGSLLLLLPSSSLSPVVEDVSPAVEVVSSGPVEPPSRGGSVVPIDAEPVQIDVEPAQIDVPPIQIGVSPVRIDGFPIQIDNSPTTTVVAAATTTIPTTKLDESNDDSPAKPPSFPPSPSPCDDSPVRAASVSRASSPLSDAEEEEEEGELPVVAVIARERTRTPTPPPRLPSRASSHAPSRGHSRAPCTAAPSRAPSAAAAAAAVVPSHVSTAVPSRAPTAAPSRAPSALAMHTAVSVLLAQHAHSHAHSHSHSRSRSASRASTPRYDPTENDLLSSPLSPAPSSSPSLPPGSPAMRAEPAPLTREDSVRVEDEDVLLPVVENERKRALPVREVSRPVKKARTVSPVLCPGEGSGEVVQVKTAKVVVKEVATQVAKAVKEPKEAMKEAPRTTGTRVEVRATRPAKSVPFAKAPGSCASKPAFAQPVVKPFAPVKPAAATAPAIVPTAALKPKVAAPARTPSPADEDPEPRASSEKPRSKGRPKRGKRPRTSEFVFSDSDEEPVSPVTAPISTDVHTKSIASTSASASLTSLPEPKVKKRKATTPLPDSGESGDEEEVVPPPPRRKSKKRSPSLAASLFDEEEFTEAHASSSKRRRRESSSKPANAPSTTSRRRSRRASHGEETGEDLTKVDWERESPLPLDELEGMVIETLATSRATSMSCEVLWRALVGGRPTLGQMVRQRAAADIVDDSGIVKKEEGVPDLGDAAQEEETKPSASAAMSRAEWLHLLTHILSSGQVRTGLFGRVESSASDSDAAGPSPHSPRKPAGAQQRPVDPSLLTAPAPPAQKPPPLSPGRKRLSFKSALRAHWYYVPERDADRERAQVIRSMMRGPGKRSETMKYKQYYWKPLAKITRWDREDEL